MEKNMIIEEKVTMKEKAKKFYNKNKKAIKLTGGALAAVAVGAFIHRQGKKETEKINGEQNSEINIDYNKEEGTLLITEQQPELDEVYEEEM